MFNVPIMDIIILYIQEVVTLQNLHQKIRFTPFFNYYDILG